jgi:hypothetical protein
VLYLADIPELVMHTSLQCLADCADGRLREHHVAKLVVEHVAPLDSDNALRTIEQVFVGGKGAYSFFTRLFIR